MSARVSDLVRVRERESGRVRVRQRLRVRVWFRERLRVMVTLIVMVTMPRVQC